MARPKKEDVDTTKVVSEEVNEQSESVIKEDVVSEQSDSVVDKEIKQTIPSTVERGSVRTEELSFAEKEKMLKKQLADLERERLLKASPVFIDVPAHELLKQTNAIRPNVKDPILAKVKGYLRKGAFANRSSIFKPIEMRTNK